MAITTLSGVASGLQPTQFISRGTSPLGGTAGALSTSWYYPGMPTAATANSSGMSGAALTAPVTGQIPFTNPVSGNSYLAGMSTVRNVGAGAYAASVPLMLVDRLWHNSGLDRTSTGAQTINSVAWPARDMNGSTNGEGVYIGVEISTTMGTGTPTISMSYTNSAGTSGRTGVGVMGAVTGSSRYGAIYVIGLQAGDTGVRSVQTVTFSATWGTAGVLHLIAFRPIAMATYNISSGSAQQKEDAFTLGMPRLYDGTVLQHCSYHPSGSPGYYTTDTVTIAQG